MFVLIPLTYVKGQTYSVVKLNQNLELQYLRPYGTELRSAATEETQYFVTMVTTPALTFLSLITLTSHIFNTPDFP
jgi:hypothetical protein